MDKKRKFFSHLNKHPKMMPTFSNIDFSCSAAKLSPFWFQQNT
uniref:Uncharacterized protein n=1 Tax=Rhizophora mucronata TaxID=61149 RepID=A0A2P2R2Q1_RHIMU